MNHKFLVAQLGARRHYAIPRMLYEAGLLDQFHTDICAVKGWPYYLHLTPKILQPAGLRRLLGRCPQVVPRERIIAQTSLGWSYARARSKANGVNQRTVVDIDYGKKFCKGILKTGFGCATATYSFNSASLELMKEAKKEGLKTVYEQTIAPRAVERMIMSQAAHQFPEWKEVVAEGAAVDEFIAREEEEWQYADLILCGSEFVRDGIAQRGGPLEKCVVVPYGVDTCFNVKRKIRKPGPLRILTVGEVGLRKGAPLVWEAARRLGAKADFRMVGTFTLQRDRVIKFPDNLLLTGVVPRSEIVEHYKWADVFLLPSLCEGSAVVTYEALLAGLPVICTPNTGSLVVDGVNGRVVDAFSSKAITEALLEWIENPELLGRCCEGVAKNNKQLNLEAYRKRLLTQLTTLKLI